MPDLGTPIAWTALPTGIPAYSADGHRVGTVRHVLGDTPTDIFDGIVLDTDHGHRFVDAPEVGRLGEKGAALIIRADEVAALPEPTAAPAVVEIDPSAVDQSPLQGKLRRAWDLISGRY
jgi:hypothetical protein